MQNLVRLEARIASLEELGELFSAMQAMAASQMQAAQASLAAIRQYTDVIERAVAAAVALGSGTHNEDAEDRKVPGLLLVMCSEHGFAGAFNRLLLERARSEVLAGEQIAVVGRRGAAIAGEHGIKPVWSLPMATHAAGVLARARVVARKLVDARAIRVVFARPRPGESLVIEMRRVLPPEWRLLEPRRNVQPPLHHLAPDVLLRRLLDDLLMGELTRAMMESFAAESAARLGILQAADHNIAGRLEKLRRSARQLRQEEITSELLEVIAGSDAVVRRDR